MAAVPSPTASLHGFVVKNTFIEIPGEGERGKNRRTSSLPPRLRGGDNDEASTMDGSDTSDTSSTSGCSDPTEGRASLKTALDQLEHRAPAGREMGGECSVPPPPPPHPEHYKASPPSTNHMERLWHPAAVPAMPLVIGPLLYGMPFADHVARLVETAAANIQQRAGNLVSTQCVQDRRGWSIVIRAPAEVQEQTTDFLLASAKTATLEAAAQSSCVYIMGYASSPFRAKQSGFGAVLGLMVDASKACWDVYERGACGRGLQCRWQHPPSVRRLYVVVRRSLHGDDAVLNESSGPGL